MPEVPLNAINQAFWQAYLDTLPEDAPQRSATYVAEAWGDNPELADELGHLIVEGRKTATCSALWEWQADGLEPTSVGTYTIVLDGKAQPIGIVETTESSVRPYNEVDEEFAAAEGEGDLTLAYWRAAHWRFFTRVLSPLNRQPSQDMPLVCERFRLVFPEQGTSQ
jgi:uncharacterized protein YhfF